MCGILGSVNYNNKLIFENSLKTMKHRGPDNQSLYEHNNVLLGHTRLSIIDLDTHSNQPMEIDDLAIAFNGEIYNYIEIRNELLTYGYDFATASDTEVIIRAYQYWGTSCVEKFNGMWTFAILDKAQESLFLSRDRLGVKPLYYIYKDKQFFFASEIKALLPFLEEKIADKDEIIRYLIYGAQEHRKETMFCDVYRFPKAHNAILNLKNDSLTFFPYFKFDINAISECSEQETQIELKKLLDNSIDLRLRSDVKIGMALSGGVDSNIIVSNVHVKNPQVESFSSVYEAGDQINENTNIDRTVKQLNLIQHYVISDVDGLIQNIEHIVYMQDEPFDTLGIYAQYKVYEVMHNAKIKVSLDGQGADEIFAGYSTYRAVLIREKWHDISFWKNYLKHNRRFIVSDIKLALVSFFPRIFERLYFYKRANLLFVKTTKFVTSKKSSFKNYQNLNQKLLNDVSEYLSVLLRYADRNSMSQSIESRGPFLDYRMIEFALSLPSGFKYKDGYGKYILRKTFEDNVDKSIIWNKEKKGFPVPQSAWCNDKKFIKLIEPYLKESKILKKLNVNTEINRNDPMFWKLINIAVWEKIYGVKIL